MVQDTFNFTKVLNWHVSERTWTSLKAAANGRHNWGDRWRKLIICSKATTFLQSWQWLNSFKNRTMWANVDSDQSSRE